MAAVPPRRRPRPGSLERPVSGRTYRGTWLLVALPLLVAAFTVGRPTVLPRPGLPPVFDRDAATRLATELAESFPDRRPGSTGGRRAAAWVVERLEALGLSPTRDRFRSEIPGLGRVSLENVFAESPGRSPEAIVVMAHRDDTGAGPGANDNASGTGALLELAGSYSSGALRPRPAHTIVFLSTDGGAWGSAGAERFASSRLFRNRVVAVINLDSIGSAGPVRLQLAGDAPRSPSMTLLGTADARIAEHTGGQPQRPSGLRQLVDLAFPFSLYEQAPFVARGISAVTITAAGERPPPPFGDGPEDLSPRRIGELGGAAEELLASVDGGLELAASTSSSIYLGSRFVRGWAVELVLLVALLPFLVAAVDLFARCRRRSIPLLPAWRSLRSRLVFWAWLGLVFGLLGLVGVLPEGDARPLAPTSDPARTWPVVGVTLLAVLGAGGWLVTRHRLLPRRAIRLEEELAGHTAALLALGVIALALAAINPFALVLILPSLHAWLWLPHLRHRAFTVRAAALAAGFLGPVLLLASFAERFGLGLDAPWYLAALVAVGYVPVPLLVILLAWSAVAGQLAALSAGRYAPYPGARERPPQGPLRAIVRTVVLAARNRRRARHDRRAAGP